MYDESTLSAASYRIYNWNRAEDVRFYFLRERGQVKAALTSIEYIRLEKPSEMISTKGYKKEKSAGTSRSEIATVNFAPASCYKRTS